MAVSDARSSFEVLVQKDNFAVLKGLWRWSMCNNRKPRIIALELLAGVSVQESVRTFLVKFEGVSKLIALLSNALPVDHRAVSAGGDEDGVDLLAVRYIVKAIVNICATNESAKQAVRSKLNHVVIGSRQLQLHDIASRDEALKFYLSMLN